jgi:hypothetical protein
VTSEKSRTHEERFRCPQCGRLVTVTAAFRAGEKGKETMARFECTMEGMCGSPIWDPCPMYMAYMERVPLASSGERTKVSRTAVRRSGRNSLKDAW